MKLIRFFFIIFFNLISSNKDSFSSEEIENINDEKSKLFKEIYDSLIPGGYFFDSLNKILSLKKENKKIEIDFINKLKQDVEEKIKFFEKENEDNFLFKILELFYSELVILSKEKNNEINLNEEKKFYINLRKFIFYFFDSTEILYKKISKAFSEFLRKKKFIDEGESLIENSFKNFMAEVKDFSSSLKT